MKLTPRQSNQGSALILTIITGTLIGTVLCSYLVLISNRNEGAMRSMAWNSAIPVLEAGIEEALSHLQKDDKRPTANFWQQVDGQSAYWKYRSFSDGSYFFVTNFDVTSPS